MLSWLFNTMVIGRQVSTLSTDRKDDLCPVKLLQHSCRSLRCTVDHELRNWTTCGSIDRCVDIDNMYSPRSRGTHALTHARPHARIHAHTQIWEYENKRDGNNNTKIVLTWALKVKKKQKGQNHHWEGILGRWQRTQPEIGRNGGSY